MCYVLFSWKIKVVLVYVVMVWYGMLRYVTLRYVTLRHVTLFCVMLCYVTLRYVTLRYVMQINQTKAVNVIGIQNTWAMTGNKQSLLSTERWHAYMISTVSDVFF